MQCIESNQSRHYREINNKFCGLGGHWWHIGRFDAFRLKGRWFESCSSRHVRTLGKYFTRSCLWRFDVKLRHSICAVSGALMISSGLEEAL